MKRRRKFYDSETEYGGKEGERSLESLASASEERGVRCYEDDGDQREEDHDVTLLLGRLGSPSR